MKTTETFIQEIRGRAAVLKSRATFQSPGFVHDHDLLSEAADRLQHMEAELQALRVQHAEDMRKTLDAS